MKIKQYVKRGIQYILHGVPEKHITAHVVTMASNDLLKGRFALITGGTSGIGFSIAKSFLNAGASVCITGRSMERLKKTCEQLQSICSDYQNRVYAVVLDNKDVSSFEVVFSEVLSIMGRIDILVNNAGILGASLPHANEEEFDAVIETNLKGVFFLSQMIGRYMKENNIKGNILNIASSSSLRPAVSAYTMSKWGIRGLTMGLAKSLAPYGITVNGVAPGPTATPMLMKGDIDDIVHNGIPAGRYVMPEEIANAAVFLVCDMGRMVMGDIIYMTGGAGILTYDDMYYGF